MKKKATIRSLIKFFSSTDAQVTCLKKILKFTLKFYNENKAKIRSLIEVFFHQLMHK